MYVYPSNSPNQPLPVHNITIAPQQTFSSNIIQTPDQQVHAECIAINNHAEPMFVQARKDIHILFKAQFRHDTISRLADMEVRLDRLITTLNISARYMMENTQFQANLMSTCNRVIELIKLMRAVQSPSVYQFCCFCRTPSKPFDGDDKIAVLATSVEQKVSNCQGEFSISLNLSGRAAVQGRVGNDVTVNTQATTFIQEAQPNMLLLQNRHNTWVGAVELQQPAKSDPYLP